MFFRDKRALGLIAALALAMGGSVLGAGCGDKDDPPVAGTGGVGGTGGTGGTGGSGGLCGGDFCAEQGETCQPSGSTEACECNPSEEECAAGHFCNPGSLRCERFPPPPMEWESCQKNGETSGDLSCVTLSLTSGGTANFWLRPCSTSDQCPMVNTFCPRERGANFVAYCWNNYCGDDVVVEDENGNPVLDDQGNKVLENGQFFGKCDVKTALLNDDSQEFGTCVGLNGQGRTVGLCERDGSAGAGDICLGRRKNAEPNELCAPGLFCNQRTFILDRACPDAGCGNGMECFGGICRPLSCTSDADCDGAEVYCGSDGVCAPTGTCIDTCNSGSDGASSREYAGCSEGNVCKAESNLPSSLPARFGICEPGTGTGGTGGDGGEGGAGGEGGEGGVGGEGGIGGAGGEGGEGGVGGEGGIGGVGGDEEA